MPEQTIPEEAILTALDEDEGEDMATSPAPAELSADVDWTTGLTFSDGIQFGCGFMLAVTLSIVLLAIVILLLLVMLSLFGLKILAF